MKRLLAAILLVFLAALQYRLWFSDGGLVKMWQLFNAAERKSRKILIC